MFNFENKFRGANILRALRFADKIFDNLNKIATENEISFNF